MRYLFELDRLDERLKMICIRFDDGFVKFANVQLKEKKFRRPSEVFLEIEKAKAEHSSSFLQTIENPAEGRIYWNENDYIKAERGILSSEEAAAIDREIVVTERLLSIINEFRRFLLEYPIQVFYSKEKESEERQIMSNKLFATADSFREVLRHNFSSYEGYSLYIDTEELEKAIRLFMGEDKYLAKVELLKKDKNAYCMYALFGNFKYQNLLELFVKDESYADDGEVSEYLKKEYGVTQSFVARTMLPTLKSLRNQIL